MTLDPDFVALLVCPISQQPLKPCTAETLTKLNGQIVQGLVVDEEGVPVERPWEAALVCADQSRVYRITAGVPELIRERSVRL